MPFQSVVAIGHWAFGGPVVQSSRVPRTSPPAMVRPVPAANWSCLRVVAPMALFSGGFVHHTQAHKLTSSGPLWKEPHRHGQWGRHRESRPRRRGVVRPRGHLCRLGKRPCSRRHPRSTTESMGDYKCWPSPAAPHCLLHDELADERMGSRPACFPWASDSRRSTYKGTECTALEWTAGPSWPCCCCYQCHPVVSRNHPQSPCICCYSTPEL